MRQENILFEKALQKATLIWKYTGMQINYDEQPMKNTLLGHLRKRWFYIGNFICLTSGVLSVFVIINVMSIQRILFMIPCMTFSFLGDIKSYYFLHHEDMVYDIIKTLKTLQTSDHSEGKDAVETKFLKKHLPFLNAANFLLLMSCYSSVATFCIGPLIIMGWQYWSTNEINLVLPYALWYPFDDTKYIGWSWAYLHQFWSVWIAVFFVYGPDCFFYTACTFVHSQFCSLKFDMEKIGPEYFKDKDSFNTHFVRLIHRHRDLIRCVDMLNIIFEKSTLYNVMSSSVIICLTGFNVTAIKNLILMIPFVAFAVLGSVQIFLLCYYGDLLMRASMEVSDAIFNSKWCMLNSTSMKYCYFILMRAERPCKITAFGFGDINLKTFSRILRTAWSYFTLLNTMYSK